jgi:hypothetical protein
MSQPNDYDPRAVARYVGRGAFISGVPTRDLTMDEWYELPPATREFALNTGLYLVVPPKRAAKREEEIGNGE